MRSAIIEADLRELQDLSTRDQGDFEAEAQRLVGRHAYQILVKAGKGMQEIADDICHMVMEKSMSSQPQIELQLGQDAAAQCHS